MATNPSIKGDRIIIPTDTNANKPSSPAAGTLFYNTTYNQLEVYNGSIWKLVAFDFSGSLYGDGSDGAATTSGTLNSYKKISSGTTSSGSTQLSLNSTTGFAVDDCICIHQSQSSTSTQVGKWEFNHVKEVVNSTTLKLHNQTLNTYYSNSFNQANAEVTQVIRVPQYSSLTLNGALECPYWDGNTGGVVAVKVSGTFNFNSQRIEVGDPDGVYNTANRYKARGFRGGTCGSCGDGAWGRQGEGYHGHNDGSSCSAFYSGGAGSYGPSGYGGQSGGGGGNAGAGGNGQNDNNSANSDCLITGGGSAIRGSSNYTDIVAHPIMGGGGGAGGDNDSHSPFGEDANGGAIVIIMAGEIQNCAIECSGTSGVGGDGAGGECRSGWSNAATSGGKSGGGAGGSVIIVTNDLNTGSSGYIKARGGFGGGETVGYNHYAGDGGGGKVGIYATDFASGTPSGVSTTDGSSSTFNIWAGSMNYCGSFNSGSNLGDDGNILLQDQGDYTEFSGFR